MSDFYCCCCGTPLNYGMACPSAFQHKDVYEAKNREVAALRADRDKLKAKVERVRALPRWKINRDTVGVALDGNYINAMDLDRALADEEQRCDLDECNVGRNPGTQHGYGKCVERRKGERRTAICHEPSKWVTPAGWIVPCGRRSGRDRRGAK